MKRRRHDPEPFEAIDRLVADDPGKRGAEAMYRAARAGGPPLCLRGASAILEGGSALVLTGFPAGPRMLHENDGPMGAAMLASAMERCGVRPVMVVDSPGLAILEGLLEAAGVRDAALETVRWPARNEEGDQAGMGPEDARAGALERCRAILDGTVPELVVAIERPGRSGDGSYRSMGGMDISVHVAPLDELLLMASSRGIPTLAVGDGGNEAGMGRIRDTVERTVKNGKIIASVIGADDLVVAGVSNWGAYGLVAAMSVLEGKRLLHAPEDELKMLEAATALGAVDGVTGLPGPGADGLPPEVHASLVSALGAATEPWLEKPVDGDIQRQTAGRSSYRHGI